jgi:hypothetical protein
MKEVDDVIISSIHRITGSCSAKEPSTQKSRLWNFLSKMGRFNPLQKTDFFFRLQPYLVKEMCHEDFFHLKDLSNQIAIKNIYKDSGKTVKMTDIKVIMVNKENPKILHYKTSYEQEDFLSISIVNVRRQEKDLQSILWLDAKRANVSILLF